MDTEAAMTKAYQKILSYPHAQVCKHWAALQVIEVMEEIGVCPPRHVVEAVVSGDDATALQHREVV